MTLRDQVAKELARWGSRIEIWIIPELNKRRVVMPETARREADRILAMIEKAKIGGGK